MRSPNKITIWTAAAMVGLAPLVGCESLPGDKTTQGTVIGGVGGAVAGAAIGKHNRVVGALIGGALGAGGGYLIGQQLEKNDQKEAQAANDQAQRTPAKADDARTATTADLNSDGFVTLDEVVAMHNAGLTNDQMIQRLKATQQVFALNDTQEKYLRDHGVDQNVVVAMHDMNRGGDDAVGSQRISS